MSVENIKEYTRRCFTEPEVLEVARSLAFTDIDGHMRHAASLGLEFSNDDLEALRKEVSGSGGELEDLSLEELEEIAGGGVTTTLAVAVSIGVGVAAGAVVGGAAGAGVGAAATSSAW